MKKGFLFLIFSPAWLLGSYNPSTGSGGGGSGLINNAAQFSIPYYSASGSSNTLSGSSNLSLSGSSLSQLLASTSFKLLNNGAEVDVGLGVFDAACPTGSNRFFSSDSASNRMCMDADTLYFVGPLAGGGGVRTIILAFPSAGIASSYTWNLPIADSTGAILSDGSGNLSVQRVAVIVSSGRFTSQTAAVSSVATYTVGSTDSSFMVSANVLVTASSTHSFNVQVTYTDEGNTSRTVTFNVQQLGGTLVTSITNITGAGPYEGVPLHIRCKASTAITILTSGTFTSVTYNVEGVITQIR
jgi:hypothetical protein